MDRPLTERPPALLLIAHRTSHGHDANASRRYRDTQGGRRYEAATYNRCLLSPMRTPSIAELSRTRSRRRRPAAAPGPPAPGCGPRGPTRRDWPGHWANGCRCTVRLTELPPDRPINTEDTILWPLGGPWRTGPP